MMFGIPFFKFWKNKRLRALALWVILVLGAFLIFSNINFERKFRTPTYPFQASILEKFLASVSQVFKIGPTKRIEVDLSQQKVKLFEGENLINEFLVSTGSSKTPTPIGRFKVYNKLIMGYSKSADCWLPFWVGFTPDGMYGFHEIPICKEGRRGLEELGEPTSQGCVRLGLKESQTFYNWVEIGTPVIIYGRQLSTKVPSTEVWCHNFEINLKFGDLSEEVRNLQIALNSDPETILAKSGPGSPGKETFYFGPLTKAAVIKFQEKYREEILNPLGLPKGTDFVGRLTRNKLNQLYGCQ